jgi:hypothetical protein
MKTLSLILALSLAAPAFAQTTPAPTSAADARTAAQGDLTGLQPSTPALQGTPQPGSPIVFVPSKPPSEAFPPPAPLDHYPICKRGHYDKCMEPSSVPRYRH